MTGSRLAQGRVVLPQFANARNNEIATPTFPDDLKSETKPIQILNHANRNPPEVHARATVRAVDIPANAKPYKALNLKKVEFWLFTPLMENKVCKFKPWTALNTSRLKRIALQMQMPHVLILAPLASYIGPPSTAASCFSPSISTCRMAPAIE